MSGLPVCTGYRLDGKVLDGPPAQIDDLARVEPIYEVLPGWKTPSTGARTFEALPAEAQAYVRFIERRIGVETMDTPAACRTYNVLATEGRNVLAALLLEPIASAAG